MSRSQDIFGIIRGIQLVLSASARTQEEYLRHLWSHSSIRDILEKNVAHTQQCGKKVFENPTKELENIGNVLKETLERSSLVAEGIRKYAKSDQHFPNAESQLTSNSKPFSFSAIKGIENLDIASITLKELENLLAEHNKIREVNLRRDDVEKTKIAPKIEPINIVDVEVKAFVSNPTPVAASLPPTPPSTNLDKDTRKVESMINLISNYSDGKAVNDGDSQHLVSSTVPEVSSRYNQF